MEIIRTIGIIAIIIFLVAYIGERIITCTIQPSGIMVKVGKILGYISTGAFFLMSACGVIALFA